MTFPTEVKIVEVGPRDGLQNEIHIVPTKTKIELINRLGETGLSVIEATSFVSPKWIPQLADAKAVLTSIRQKQGVSYPVLVPNLKGLENAIAAGAKAIAVFTTPSEKFSQKNTHCSVEESVQRIREVIQHTGELPVRAYLSCVLGCPYEGEMDPAKVATLAETLLQMGCNEISLGDTIGAGTPFKTNALLQEVKQRIPIDKIAVHFHDTYGCALANIYVALENGVSIIDSSIAGLGGCPYAPGASGNVATEDVVYMLNEMGIKTHVDLTKLIETGQYISAQLKRPIASKVSLAYAAKRDI